jgi:MFS family permease
MVVSAGLSLIGALAALLFLPETRQGTTGSPAVVMVDDNNDKRGEWPQLLSAIGIYSINRLVVAGILLATFGLFLAQNLDENVRIGTTSFGIGTLTGLGLGATTLIGMIAAPIAGNLSDKIGSRWRVISSSLISGIVGFLFLSIGVPVMVLIGLPLISIASGSNSSTSTAIVGDLSPAQKRGQRLGLFFTAGDLGSALGPIIAYSLMPLIGLSAIYRLGAAFYGISLIGALGWAFVIIPRRSAVIQR